MADWQYYWNPWFWERHEYFVPLPPPRCRELLEEGASFWLPGRVGRRRIFTGADLWLYRRTFYANNSKPYARIRCRPAPGGASVEVTIGIRPISRIWAAAWFGLLGIFTLITLGGAVTSRQWMALALPLAGAVFVGIGLVMFALGRLLARRDPEFLLDYIKDRLIIQKDN